MRAFCTLAMAILTMGGALLPANAQTVVVPETTFGIGGADVSAALLDTDSVFVAYTDYAVERPLGTTRFQVININTGAIELSPIPLANGMRGAQVATLGPNSALIVVRDDNPLGGSRGKFFVVNPLTGQIIRGPVLFSTSSTSSKHHLTVVDPSTVLIADRSDDGLKGVFTVIDPQTGTIKVPEKPFDPTPINGVDVVALDGHQVMIAYDRLNSVDSSSYVIVDPQTGTIVAPPIPFQGPIRTGGYFRLRKLSATDVLVCYLSQEADLFFVLNTVTGVATAPTTTIIAPGGGVWPASPTLLGIDRLFLPFGRDPSTGNFVVYDVSGDAIIPETSFKSDAVTRDLSSVASGCRVIVLYEDIGDGQGKFQVIDFSDVCTPVPCPEEVTDQVDIFRFRIHRVPFTSFRFQWVLIRNKTADPIPGPLSLVTNNLQRAVFLGSRKTFCFAPAGDPFAVLHAGSDDVLSPGESTLALLLFFQTQPGRIVYTPRVMNGIPTQ